MAIKSLGNSAAASAQASIAQAAAFYAAATERSIELPRQSYVSASTLNFNLPPSGIGTWVQINFAGTLTVTSGATASQPTASPWYPYNLLTISYVDYLGFTRCNASGWQLHLLEQIRTHQFDPSNPLGVVAPAQAGAQPQISSAVETLQFAGAVPTAVASGSPTEPIAFSFVVPISLNKASIKGSHLFNITGAQDVLGVNCIAPTGGPNAADSPLTVPIPADTSCSVSGTVDVCYYYLDWPSGVQVPMAELALAHQVNSVTQNTNIILHRDALEVEGVQLVILDGDGSYFLIHGCPASSRMLTQVAPCAAIAEMPISDATVRYRSIAQAYPLGVPNQDDSLSCW